MSRIFALEPAKFGLAKQRADITTQNRNDRINLKTCIRVYDNFTRTHPLLTSKFLEKYLGEFKMKDEFNSQIL